MIPDLRSLTSLALAQSRLTLPDPGEARETLPDIEASREPATALPPGYFDCLQDTEDHARW